MIEPVVSRLVEDQFKAVRIVERAASAPRCDCGSVLQGTASMWCGTTVPAADLDHQTHAPLTTGGAR